MLHTMHDSELIRRCTLDHTRIMFVTDLIKDMLTSLTLRRNAIAPEMDVKNKEYNVCVCVCARERERERERKRVR